MYRLFTDDHHVKKPNIPIEFVPGRVVRSKEDQKLRALAKLLSRMDDNDHVLLLHRASKLASRS